MVWIAPDTRRRAVPGSTGAIRGRVLRGPATTSTSESVAIPRFITHVATARMRFSSQRYYSDRVPS